MGEATLRRSYTGEYGFITMELSISVLCVQNFEGSDCSQCVTGLTGTNCDTEIDNCVGVTCSGNGQCVDGINSFSCDCDPGFVGDFCEDISTYKSYCTHGYAKIKGTICCLYV